jgi:S-formylglutathione hydrolase FrmB
MKRISVALMLGLGVASSALAQSQVSICSDLYGNGDAFECTPNPNSQLSCPTSSPTNAEMAVVGGVTAACPRPPVLPAGYPQVPATYPAGDLDARVRDVLVYSEAMQEEVWVRLILPPSFATSPVGTTFPVFYLLTGNGASYQSWSCNTLIQNYVANTDVIVVMPDASRYNVARCARPQKLGDEAIPGWYSDWNSPSADGNPEQWETFHMVELPRLLKAKYKASDKLAIAGLSMGGYGAMKYAAKNLVASAPEMHVVAAASYSGLLNTVSQSGFTAVTGSLTLAGQDTNAPWSYYPGTPYANLWGTRWPENNPTALVGNFIGSSPTLLRIPLFIAVGDGSQGRLVSSYDLALGTIEAAAKPTNQNFQSALRNANGNVTPSNFTAEYYRGTHQWRYWDAELCRSLPMLMRALGFANYTSPLTCNTPF